MSRAAKLLKVSEATVSNFIIVDKATNKVALTSRPNAFGYEPKDFRWFSNQKGAETKLEVLKKYDIAGTDAVKNSDRDLAVKKVTIKW